MDLIADKTDLFLSEPKWLEPDIRNQTLFDLLDTGLDWYSDAHSSVNLQTLSGQFLYSNGHFQAE
jgi:hypothetical protein